MDEIAVTWGQRCSKLQFICRPSHEPASKTPCFVLPEDYYGYREIIHHLRAEFGDEYDWFLEAGINSYVVVRNLKHFLSKHDPQVPHLFGRIWTNVKRKEVLVPGNVLSNKALYMIASELDDVSAFADYIRGMDSDEMLQYIAIHRLDLTVEPMLGPDGNEALIPIPLKDIRKYSRKNIDHRTPGWFYFFNPTSKELEDTVSRFWVSSVLCWGLHNFCEGYHNLGVLHRRIEHGKEASGKLPSENEPDAQNSLNPGSAEQQMKKMKPVDWTVS